ncbi:hypothetical protein BJF78_04880 [Pseudonocardia sp. CNS-139]|nr:hypothetical protein BJF78_04880 [Pseudonocardia sp. CNS-139]
MRTSGQIPPTVTTPARRRAGWAVVAVVDTAARVGSVVTLAALLVLAATAAGLADGVTAGEAPTVTVTYER